MVSVPPEPESRPMSFLAAAGWTVVVVLLYTFALSIAEAMHEGALADLVTRTTCGALAYSVVLFVILRVHEPEGSIRSVLALRPPPILAIPLALVVGGGLAGPGAWLDSMLLRRFPYSEQEQLALERVYGAATEGTSTTRVTLVVTMVLISPILDELFFRGALFTPLQKGRRLEPVVMATAAYETLVSTPHPREMLSFFALALALSWMRGLTRSVFPSIVARIAFLATRFVPAALGRELPALSGTALVGSLGAALVSFVALVLVSRRVAAVTEPRAEDG